MCTGKTITINELAKTVVKLWGDKTTSKIVHGEARDGDIKHSACMPDGAKNALGFTAQEKVEDVSGFMPFGSRGLRFSICFLAIQDAGPRAMEKVEEMRVNAAIAFGSVSLFSLTGPRFLSRRALQKPSSGSRRRMGLRGRAESTECLHVDSSRGRKGVRGERWRQVCTDSSMDVSTAMHSFFQRLKEDKELEKGGALSEALEVEAMI